MPLAVDASNREQQSRASIHIVAGTSLIGCFAYVDEQRIPRDDRDGKQRRLRVEPVARQPIDQHERDQRHRPAPRRTPHCGPPISVKSAITSGHADRKRRRDAGAVRRRRPAERRCDRQPIRRRQPFGDRRRIDQPSARDQLAGTDIAVRIGAADAWPAGNETTSSTLPQIAVSSAMRISHVGQDAMPSRHRTSERATAAHREHADGAVRRTDTPPMLKSTPTRNTSTASASDGRQQPIDERRQITRLR